MLKLYNVDFVGRDRKQAKPGDLLFFHQPWVQKYPFHVMMFLGEPRIASEGANDWVVCHTGASAHDAGAVKKVMYQPAINANSPGQHFSFLDRTVDKH